MLEKAAVALGPLKDEVVFVGGCVVSILLTDDGAPPPRPTDDVDTLIEAATYVEYIRVEKRMRAQGFSQKVEEKVICRWYGHGLIVDVMPSSGEILGFSNQWYPSALKHSKKATLPNGISINHIDAPHFVATKLDAFNDRGMGDIYGSHDLEDVLAVVDGRPELIDEFRSAPLEIGGICAGDTHPAAEPDKLPRCGRRAR